MLFPGTMFFCSARKKTQSEVNTMHPPISSRRRMLALLLCFMLSAGLLSPSGRAAWAMPQQLTLNQGQSWQLPRGITALSSTDESLLQSEHTLQTHEVGKSQVSVSLFGLFPLRDVEVEVREKRVLIPGGQSVGVAMQMAGVMVVGVAREGGAEQILKAGDTLLSLNGQPVNSAEEMTALVENSQGQPLHITYLRNGQQHEGLIQPLMDTQSGQYRLGIWVRSSTAGVGTLTFYDPETHFYGALGHAVNDSDTGRLFSVRTGKLLRASIVDVKKGLRGAPGELRGTFLKDPRLLGDIRRNTVYGVYGQADALSSPLYSSGLPVGWRSSVHTGKATILSTVDDGGVRAYDVEITQVSRQRTAAQKSFVIKVTDEELLSKTGGIVQGMSGSPVIQDGCLIGAVTHVFVDDPTQGYGLYIEWMLQEADLMAADEAA